MTVRYRLADKMLPLACYFSYNSYEYIQPVRMVSGQANTGGNIDYKCSQRTT